MPKIADFILQTRINNIEDFSPEKIARSPRTFRPIDVLNACKNICLVNEKQTIIPKELLSISYFICLEYFSFAHSTGLYNRQIKLWEAISKINKIEILQLEQGLFKKEKLDEFEFRFFDHKKRLLTMAYFAKPEAIKTSQEYLKNTKEFLKRSCLSQGMPGVFVCFAKPFPESVLEWIYKESHGEDSIAYFESFIDKFACSVNLVEIDLSTLFIPENQTEIFNTHLIYPDLNKRKSKLQKDKILPVANLDP